MNQIHPPSIMKVEVRLLTARKARKSGTTDHPQELTGAKTIQNKPIAISNEPIKKQKEVYGQDEEWKLAESITSAYLRGECSLSGDD